MLTTIMKWCSLVALTGSLFFWRPGSGYAILLQFVICGSAGLVALQAAQSSKNFWTVAFAALAVLFNPLLVFSLSAGIFLWTNILCFAMFLVSLKVLKANPRLSMPSITYPGSPNQSL